METSTAAKADAIAHATARTISIRMNDDPTLYQGFAELVRQAMQDFKEGRLSAIDYVAAVTSGRSKVINLAGTHDVPGELRGDEFASAVWRRIVPLLRPVANGAAGDLAAESVQAFARIVASHRRIGWQGDPDVEKAIRNAIDDYLDDEVKAKRGLYGLDGDVMDDIIRQAIENARRHAAA